MNHLQIGLADKHFEDPNGSLVITDEPALKRGEKLYDPAKHGLNPLPMQYREAREFAAAVFPDKDLMTYRNGRRALTRLVMDAKRLDKLVYTRDDDDQEAEGVVDDIVLSPLLAEALRKPIPRWFFSGATIAVRLNRKEIGDDDAKIAASILISQFKGPVVSEDFGCYARPTHVALIREDRLMAGVYTLAELDPKLRQMCLLMEKEAVGCTYEDAEVLAKYAGHVPATNAFNAFVQQTMASN
ncbi:hypothetical protein IVB41_16095 [Bradyrhizobium sp. 44]|uniref:hypothetical protein n=1 Tax=Bradyrhizobium sp. 44 TaxID=2782675 RepID=UPI001FF91AF5|nr:hypothetical protein [Bradyrhizobium sp. 44]MCK1285441.1 hypothetical protein [Bradyrhizobium sp. 44]